MNGKKKRIALLGATGSIGTSTLRVLRAMPEAFELVLISAGWGNIPKLAEIAAEFKVPHTVTAAETSLPQLRSQVPAGTTAYAGEKALCDLLSTLELDLVVSAIVGNAAIPPVVAAIGAGRDIALASKEVLVAAGYPVMKLAAEKKVRILPVDSEHSALFQCLEGHSPENVEKLILTASGGPFRGKSFADLAGVTWADAMKHPTWSMGPKVTLDSATLMNKALEMVEAHHLFQMSGDRIDVLVHPQSIIHSIVEWRDGNQTALLSVPDMCFPIQYALTLPDRINTGLKRLDLAQTGSLTFERVDERVFPSLSFARTAMREQGTLAAVMNAANDVAGVRFREGEIALPGIWTVIEKTMSDHQNKKDPTLEEIFAADEWARAYAASLQVK
ncbi:MAG: 1-deoxy-D-xylulose-5-phosphate reductoisomerase [Lentisphaeria bacterium]|nr:1-deoxy-D-xylulose-5-phosphate reductoisomerase [Lentisphaeria bacterium]